MFSQHQASVGSLTTPSSVSALLSAQKNFSEFTRLVSCAFNVTFPEVEFENIKKMKEFCSGLLLPNGTAHPWAGPARALSKRDRLSLRGSLFLFRKVLPSPKPDLKAYARSMCTPAPPPPSGYYEHCTKVLCELFPVGWDGGWKGRVKGTTASVSSTLEATRKVGGGRSLLGDGWLDRECFVNSLLDKYSNRHLAVSLARMAIAPTKGKFRAVSINSVEMVALKPYHKLVYDHITEQEWCIRGDALARRFSNFQTKKGEIFVSGDYESATDNLNADVARHILSVISRRCTRVPVFIREAAGRTIGCELDVDGERFRTSRGQLMGNAMSFPLLCLQNYLAFTFFVRRSVPVRINGDDIVFRATQEEADRWVAGVKSCGLTLSLGKTMFSASEFSLNSTFFVSGTRYVRMAPVIRSTCFFLKLESVGGLVGRFAEMRFFRPEVRARLQIFFIRRFYSSFLWCQRSLTRGLGLRVSDEVLKLSGLFDREIHYLSLNSEPTLPPDKHGVFLPSIPAGWSRRRLRTPVDKPLQKEFAKQMVAEAWKPTLCTFKPPDVQSETGRYLKPNFGLRARLLKKSVKDIRKMSRRRWNPVSRKWDRVSVRDYKKKMGKPRWVYQEVEKNGTEVAEQAECSCCPGLVHQDGDYSSVAPPFMMDDFLMSLGHRLV